MIKCIGDSRYKLLQSILLPSMGFSFLATNYLFLSKVGPSLHWSFSFYGLYTLLLLGFFISWIYASTFRKEYYIIKAALAESSSVKTVLLEKVKTLSRKEHEVMTLILKRKNNQQICDELFISHSTLKSHINHIYKKLEITRRQEMLALFEEMN
jgi:DNA-binding CsgD family transcriptional regulator